MGSMIRACGFTSFDHCIYLARKVKILPWPSQSVFCYVIVAMKSNIREQGKEECILGQGLRILSYKSSIWVSSREYEFYSVLFYLILLRVALPALYPMYRIIFSMHLTFNFGCIHAYAKHPQHTIDVPHDKLNCTYACLTQLLNVLDRVCGDFQLSATRFYLI